MRRYHLLSASAGAIAACVVGVVALFALIAVATGGNPVAARMAGHALGGAVAGALVGWLLIPALVIGALLIGGVVVWMVVMVIRDW